MENVVVDDDDDDAIHSSIYLSITMEKKYWLHVKGILYEHVDSKFE